MRSLVRVQYRPLGSEAVAAPGAHTDPEPGRDGRPCTPRRLMVDGFAFQFPQLDAALRNLVAGQPPTPSTPRGRPPNHPSLPDRARGCGSREVVQAGHSEYKHPEEPQPVIVRYSMLTGRSLRPILWGNEGSSGRVSSNKGVAMELAERKALGAFYTPPDIARYICQWAIRSRVDRVLEPSCGNAVFLLAAAYQLERAEGSLFDHLRPSLSGVEIDPRAVIEATERLHSAGYSAEIHACDFFDFMPSEKFDCIVGNPPYIRYQQFAGESRTKAIRSALAAGVSLNGLASSWAAFVVHCSRLLKAHGRLGLVLPAELLTVKYAGPVREFLLKRFARIQMITFEQRVFTDAQEDVVLLLAEGTGRTKHFEVYPASSVACLASPASGRWCAYAPKEGDSWSLALLPASQRNTLHDAVQSAGFCTLSDWGTTYLGAVTGNNNFFALRAEEVDAAGLRATDLRKISPPGSKHLRSTMFSSKSWRGLAKSGSKCFLFYPRARLSRSAAKYIALGERRGVHGSYKCSVRDPWWVVPLVEQADLLLTYMDADRPRLVRNLANVDHLNSLYGIRLHHGNRGLASVLPVASVNSLTIFGAEVIGRSYGGGMLKLEPREADKLPMPSIASVRDSARRLMCVESQVSTLAAQGRLQEACAIVDSILLDGVRGHSAWIAEVRSSRELLRNRRRARTVRDVGN